MTKFIIHTKAKLSTLKSNLSLVNMRMKKYGINVREIALQPREKQKNLQILRSHQGLQLGWNTIPCEKP